MNLRRLRAGELLVLLGLAGLVASLFVRWFSVDLGGEALQNLPCCAGLTPDGDVILTGPLDAGWSALGHPWLEGLAAVVITWIVVLGLALRSGPGRPTYGAVISIVVAIPVTALVLSLTLVRTLLARPDAAQVNALALFGNIDRLRELDAIPVGRGDGTWIGLASLLVGLVGLWIAMADDRTDAAGPRRRTPRPGSPRPAPRTL